MKAQIKDIINVFNEVLHCEDLLIEENLDANLSQFGMNSLKSIELIVHFEELFNIEFVDEDLLLNNFSSVSEIIRILNQYNIEIENR